VSAAFQLDFTGPQTSCDYPGCKLNAFHEGEHEFATPEEKHARLLGSANHYGTNTRSYNRSAEKHEMDRQRKEATARYLSERAESDAPPKMKTQLDQAKEKIAKAELSDAHSVSLTRGEWSALWMADPRNRKEVFAPVVCTCAQRPYPHEVGIHKKIGAERPGVYYDYYDTAIRFAEKEMRWPWSLRWAPEMEA
jgi:hypothetical protein